jgi:hypothetical protein
MAGQTERRTALDKLLGKKKKVLDEKLDELGAFLDSVGINSKEFRPVVKKLQNAGVDLDEFNAEYKEWVVVRFKGLLEDLQPQLMAVLDGLTDDEQLKTEAANQALAVVMGAFATASEDEVVEEEPMDEMAEEIMQEDGEEEDEEEEVVMAQMHDAVVALAQETSAVNEAWVNDAIPAMIETNTLLKELARKLDSVVDKKDHEKRIKQLEGIINLRPRTASKADETIVKEDEQSAKLKHAIQSGVEGESRLLSIPVKPGSYPKN